MTPQSNFLIVSVIKAERIDELRQLLSSMNTKPGLANPHNKLIPFAKLGNLHVARFTILEAKTAEDICQHAVPAHDWKTSLAFLGDCDGPAQNLLETLVQTAEPGLRQIFSYCEDFKEDQSLLDWMHGHSIAPQANYINWVGRTVQQVREEAALQQNLSNHLQSIVHEAGSKNIRALRQSLLTHVELEIEAGHLTLTAAKETPFDWKIRNLLHKFGIPLILLLIAPVLLIFAPLIVWWLRQLETTDPEITLRPDRQHISTMSIQEDQDVSNHFNVFGDVKPGWFRLYLLKFLLLLLDYSARHIYNRGYLTRIRSIHFARWVLLENNHHLFFSSNYDGSHESYMDDFVNKVAWGLNLVFSNGVSYPRTRWLVKGGAEREHLYKYTLRRHQLPSEVWYKAYPGLTAYDLSRNSRIRAGVEHYPESDDDIREWLRLL